MDDVDRANDVVVELVEFRRRHPEFEDRLAADLLDRIADTNGDSTANLVT